MDPDSNDVLTRSSSEGKRILSSLGFKVKLGKNKIIVQVPTWRPDVEQEVDLID